MPYRLPIKSLPTALRNLLREPTAIAGLASIGIHGLLWVVLPILPLQSSEVTEPEIQRPVSLVELTPAEQSRLPDFSTAPPVVLPPLTQDSDLYSLTPLPNSLTPIPTQPLPAQPAIPRYQGLPPLFIPSLPPPPPYTFPPRTTIPPRRPSPPPPPSTPSPSPTDAGEATPSPSATPTPSEESPTNGGTPSPVTSSPNGESGASPSPSPESQPSPAAIARALQEQQRLRAWYSYNPEGTGDGDGGRASLAWFTETLEQPLEEQNNNQPGFDDIQKVTIAVAFPMEACVLRPRQSPIARFGVVIEPDGDLIGSPVLLQSAGYGIFNQKGLEAVTAHEFNKESDSVYVLPNQNQPIFVTVRFASRPDTCPSITMPAPTADG